MADKEFAWRLAAELVRIESTDPGCYEERIEAHLKELVAERVAALPHELAEHIEVRELDVLPGRRDLMVRVPGTGPEAALVYSCHMDTVTIGDGWSEATPPLEGRVVDDRLYGRGACDMKSGLACAVAALFSLLDRMAETGEFPRREFSASVGG